MAIRAYTDVECTKEIKYPQKFTRANTVLPYQVFTLTKMAGTELDHLYKYNGISHIKLIQGTDFSLSGNNITLASALGAAEVLLAIPKDRLNMNFGGAFGATKTNTSFVMFKRDPANIYDNLVLASEDLDLDSFAVDITDQAFNFTPNSELINSDGQAVTGTLCSSPTSGISGLTINALEGYALTLNNQYIGIIIANGVDTILVNNPTFSYTGSPTDDISIFSIGTLLFALDANGIPSAGAFKPVINLPDLTIASDRVKVWLKDTVVIPETAQNYPDMAFKISGIEYIA